MKKTGFTLAEILVTIGIIGVVSALVIPTFTAQTQRAKIGPKLGKAVASFEQATKAILDDAQVDRLTRATVPQGGVCSNGTFSGHPECLFLHLQDHLKGSFFRDPDVNILWHFVSSDGIEYRISSDNAIPAGTPPQTSQLAHQRELYRGKDMTIVIGSGG